MPGVEGQDALSQPPPSSSFCPAPNIDIIVNGSDQEARQEIANALKNIADTINAYITRKGV